MKLLLIAPQKSKGVSKNKLIRISNTVAVVEPTKLKGMITFREFFRKYNKRNAYEKYKKAYFGRASDSETGTDSEALTEYSDSVSDSETGTDSEASTEHESDFEDDSDESSGIASQIETLRFFQNQRRRRLAELADAINNLNQNDRENSVLNAEVHSLTQTIERTQRTIRELRTRLRR